MRCGIPSAAPQRPKNALIAIYFCFAPGCICAAPGGFSVPSPQWESDAPPVRARALAPAPAPGGAGAIIYRRVVPPTAAKYAV